MGSMKAYRRIVWGLLVLSIIGTIVYGYVLLESSVPDQLMLMIDKTEELEKIPSKVSGFSTFLYSILLLK